MANEKPLQPPKGFKSAKRVLAQLCELAYKNRPLPSPTCDINEMPDGRQIVPKPGGTKGAPLEVAMAVWPGPVTKLVRIQSFGQRDVPEVEE